MNIAERAVRAVDRAQQRHPWLGYPVAVGKKFGDDQAGNLAALVAYFAFASLFPLLLVLVTVLDIVLRGDPALLAKVRSSAFAQFPVIGPEYLSKINAMHATGPALAIGLVLTFLGSRGVANAMQNALNSVWGVPLERRPGFPWNLLRSIGQVLVIGLGLIITTTLSGIASGASLLPGPASTAAAIVVSYGLNIGVFWAAFRLGTAGEITGRELFPSALLAAATWQLLLLLGGFIVGHQLAHSQSLYGVFGIVLGLLAWLYLQAQFTLYAVEASVVRRRGLWPRSLAPPPLTAQDRRALAMYARAQQRRPEVKVGVRNAEPGRPGDSGAEPGEREHAGQSASRPGTRRRDAS
jgi:YihY family inner membrane protein